MTKGRVLIVGSTGFIGKFVAEASIHSGRPTYILVRPGSDSIRKAKVVESLQQKGAIVLHGVITDKQMMEKMLREYEIEIVISAVGGKNVKDQSILVDAIKSVGTVKRFIPSEFGHDVDRAKPVEPGMSVYQEKRNIRRLIEKFHIPYTYICCNSIASWPYHDTTRPSDLLPPLDHFQIYGQGTVKAYFVDGADIGKFTLKAVEDVRTLNKCVHFRPSCNFYNMNELASLWETKINRTLPRIKITENELLTIAAENNIPMSIVASIIHDIFIKGCQVDFTIDGSNDVEVSDLYPDEPFRTLDECFNDFAAVLHNKSNGLADILDKPDEIPNVMVL